jgi:Leucine-rich repeat (LRR) protein
LKSLARLRYLEDLKISYCKISSDGIANLLGQTNLRYLDISGNNGVDDNAGVWLGKISHLRSLNIIGTGITRNILPALKHASELKKIEFNNFQKDKISGSDIKQILPNCMPVSKDFRVPADVFAPLK